MQTLWINGALTALTPRQELRLHLPCASMNDVERMRTQALISDSAYRRFVRLWAVSTATEHPFTRSWTLERWRLRRERACRAIKALG